MRTARRTRARRGFTVIELLFAMAILGLVLGLVLAEFTATFNNFQFEQTHMDAEAAGRVAMARVNDALQLATPDLTDTVKPADPNCIKHCSILASPLANSGASSVAFFVGTNDVANNQELSKSMKIDIQGNPVPGYDVIVLQHDPAKAQLLEYRMKASDYLSGASWGTPSVVATNVNAAKFYPINCASTPSCTWTPGVQVDLTTVGPLPRNVSTNPYAFTSNTMYFTSSQGY